MAHNPRSTGFSPPPFHMANLTLVLTVFKHFNTGAFTWPTGVAVNCHIKCELNGCNNGARDNVLVFLRWCGGDGEYAHVPIEGGRW